MKHLKMAAAGALALVVFVAVMLPVLAQGGGLSRNPFDWVIAKQLTVNGYITDRATALRLQDVKVRGGGNVRAETEATTGTTTITSTFTNPDYPRNIEITIAQKTGTYTGIRTAGNIYIYGIDARGISHVDTVAMTAISASQTLTGVVPFATLTQVVIPAQTFPVSVTLSLGKKFGLTKAPLVSTADVFFFTTNNTQSTSFTVDRANGTVQPTTDPTANDDYTIWFKQ